MQKIYPEIGSAGIFFHNQPLFYCYWTYSYCPAQAGFTSTPAGGVRSALIQAQSACYTPQAGFHSRAQSILNTVQYSWTDEGRTCTSVILPAEREAPVILPFLYVFFYITVYLAVGFASGLLPTAEGWTF